ncbi:hypothetical protein GCM10010988_33780 [Cnuibacter physcomitrellae]|uniref:Uncharacterized protein n=1 Tax=Cnuibacter physcomitrellae TaxID=1619308 RepID=A0A1X9LH93_9MICO|nr:hypothetical protein [Cnuibacter physcomitrellae]ARJ04575.1 hypothetical protein B5808_04560 [Cnuibacter physcomitrellae]GGI41374.1 hypothetical protein GCM10010988_33780 [Cnuibacter physcomitrellae]
MRRLLSFAAASLTTTALIFVSPLVADARPPVAPPSPGSHVLWHDVALPPGVQPSVITTAADGTVWFADGASSRLLAYDPATGSLAPYPLASDAFVVSIVEAADGAIWYSDPTAETVSRLDPDTGVIDETLMPAGIRPLALAASPDGSIWFGTSLADEVGHVAHGAPLELVTLAGSGGIPVDVTWGPDGRLWVAQYGVGAIDAYDPVSTRTTSYPISAFATSEIEAGADGALWLVDNNSLHRVGIDGSDETFIVPASSIAFPFSLTRGGDAVLYADTEGRILSVASDGAFTPLGPGGAGHLPQAIALAPDGSLWYTDPLRASLGWG